MASVRFALVALAVAGCFSHVSAATWDYGPNGPSTWARNYNDCGLSQQSPIDIKVGSVSTVTTGSKLSLSSTSFAGTLANNGHSLQTDLSANTIIQLTGGPLNGTYQAAQFHLHFSASGGAGSEHEINSVYSAAELHIVTFNTRFGTIGKALNQTEGLAVIGIMLAVSNETVTASQDMNDFLTGAASLTFKGMRQAPVNYDLMNMLPADFATSFYTYPGSLTTPPCGESVVWLLCKTQIYVSEDKITNLASVKTGTTASSRAMSGNRRPPQPLGSRTVELYSLPSSSTDKARTTALMLAASLAALFALLF